MAPDSIFVEEEEVETLLVASELSETNLDDPKTDISHHTPNFASRILRLSWSIFNLLLLGINLELILMQSSRNKDFFFRGAERSSNSTLAGTTTTTEVPEPRNSSSGYRRYDKIFGHVHMAKTAGTEINGELAAHYERVCGHKGYSYDAVQLNKHAEQMANSHNGTVQVRNVGPDLISVQYPQYNRGRVPFPVMREIGFEDCDYVSIEQKWQTWTMVAEVWPVELHVPCRDPLEHLMSQCNHLRHTFNCQAPSLAKEVQRCLVGFDRFDAHLMHMDNVTVKCFSAVPMEPYLEYMDQFLERKRVESPYIHRSSNAPRQKDHECIWNNTEVANQVLDHLHTLYYYRWCEKCIGSENDLLRLPR